MSPHFGAAVALRHWRLKLCIYCCTRKATTIDHVWPWSRGGDYHRNNRVPACRPCNQAKASRSVLKLPCPHCAEMRSPKEVDTAAGWAVYHCSCGRVFDQWWDLPLAAYGSAVAA